MSRSAPLRRASAIIEASVRDENAMPEGVRREFISSERDVDELPSRPEPRPIVEFPVSFRSLSRVL